jgi:hypothetical protein
MGSRSRRATAEYWVVSEAIERRTVVEKRYHIVEKENTEVVWRFLSKNGRALLPLVEQIEQAEVALDELGRATVGKLCSYYLRCRIHDSSVVGDHFGSREPASLIF